MRHFSRQFFHNCLHIRFNHSLATLKNKLRDGHKPLVRDFEAGMKECHEAGDLLQVLRYFASMQGNFGMTPSIGIYHCVLSTYGKMNKASDAMALFELMKKLRMVDQNSYLALIKSLETCGQFRRAHEVYKEMIAERVPVNEEILEALIRSFAMGLDWMSAYSIYKESPINPETDKVFNAMVLVLSASAKPTKERAAAALSVVEDMKAKGIEVSPQISRTVQQLLEKAHEKMLLKDMKNKNDS